MRLDLIGVVALALAAVVAGCSTNTAGVTLPDDQAAQYPTAYISEVEPAPEGDDLAKGAGEFVVIEQNADIRVDMGGWYIDDADGNRLNLGIGRQIDVGAKLRVYSSCGRSTDEVVFACAGAEVLDDNGDDLVLRDSAGGEVARFAYGEAAE